MICMPEWKYLIGIFLIVGEVALWAPDLSPIKRKPRFYPFAECMQIRLQYPESVLAVYTPSNPCIS